MKFLPTTILTWLPGGARGNYPEVSDGDQYLVAMRLASDRWEYAVITASCDGELPMRWYCDGEPWMTWAWQDVEWYMPVNEIELPNRGDAEP